MNHIAIDLGSTESQICVREPDGTVLEQARVRTNRLRKFLSSAPPSRVIVETGAEAFHVADIALELGHEPRVVPATLARTLGVGARGVKTDQRDALALSEVSCRVDLPSVHIPSEEARQRKAESGSRQRLIAARTMLINHVRGWLRTKTLRVPGRGMGTFSARVRAKVDGPDGLPAHIDRVLESIDALNEQIASADRELSLLTEGHELYERLMSVPGVGPVTAVRFVASIDEVSRFPNAHALQSYLGLTPGERSSGAKTRRTGITKAGPADLRAALVQAAWCAMNLRRRCNDPMMRWARRIADRRGKAVAVIALARKISGILFAIWRDDTRYDASRGADQMIG